jgi:hypothetical protein
MNFSTLIQRYSHSFKQAISGEDDFVIATGSSDVEEIQIKIWTPIKVIQEIPKPLSSPRVAHQGGISIGQLSIMIIICVLVQIFLVYTPKDQIAELLGKVPFPSHIA